MQNTEINRQIQKIKALIAKAREASKDNLDLQSHWARYICVLVSGFIENSIKEIYSDFIKTNSAAPVASYSINNLLKLQNPNTEKILGIVGSFKKDWMKEVEEFVNAEGRKDAIDSIINNRHQIAHGKDVGITITRVSNYLEKVIETMTLIESLSKQ
jgi:hypothetical protein